MSGSFFIALAFKKIKSVDGKTVKKLLKLSLFIFWSTNKEIVTSKMAMDLGKNPKDLEFSFINKN